MAAAIPMHPKAHKASAQRKARVFIYFGPQKPVLSRAIPGGQAGFGAAGGKQRVLPSPARRQTVPCGHLQFGGVPIMPPEHAAVMAAATHVPPRNTLPCGQSQPPPILGTMPPRHWNGVFAMSWVHRPSRKTLPAGQSHPPPALGTMPSRHRGGAFAMSWMHRPPRRTLPAGQTTGVGRATGGGLVATTGGGGLVGAGRTRWGGFNGMLSAGICIGGGGTRRGGCAAMVHGGGVATGGGTSRGGLVAIVAGGGTGPGAQLPGEDRQ
jgi:hypothetical protein